MLITFCFKFVIFINRKIYAVRHNYDNGEQWEDYREYVNDSLFSTYEKANTFFWDKVTSDYEGKYSLIEWELDTQEQVLLDESEWLECKPQSWDDYSEYEDDYEEYEPECDYNDDYTCAEYESLRDELQAEEEWLNHKGENYEVFHQIEIDQLEDALKESEEAFRVLGMIE